MDSNSITSQNYGTQTITQHKFEVDNLIENQRLASLAAIEEEAEEGLRKYFKQENFTKVNTPHITGATGACENINTVFALDYFGKKAYLAQTGQLYLEALIPKLKKTYCCGKSFRSEPDVDERHLVEFGLFEIEFEGEFEELLEHIEKAVESSVKSVLEKAKTQLEELNVDPLHIKSLSQLKTPFDRITYEQAILLLNSKGYNINWGDDLKSRHEAEIVKHFQNKPVFITHFPACIKFFNMRINDENPRVVNSSDLLLPYSGEAVGAAQREERIEILNIRLEESEMLRLHKQRGGSKDDFSWYLNLVKTGKIPVHSGCGFGMNRIVQYILGSNDIRHSTIYPWNGEVMF